MAIGTRRGDGLLRPGEKPALPPPTPARMQRGCRPTDRLASHRPTSTTIAVVATLDIEAVYRQLLRGDLPPAVRSAFVALDDPEWTAICRQAIRAQSQLLDETDGVNRHLRRDRPWLLADFLPTMRS
jgi:hypothetical protein